MAGILTAKDKEQVSAAIIAAEAKTAGEIRVHVEPRCGGDPFGRARELFEKFGMTRTRDRSGVLIYVAWKDRKIAVLGDAGIHEKAGHGYWEGVVAKIAEAFKESRYGDGLAAAVEEVGERLAEHFPPRPDDKDELANEVTEET